MTTATLRHNTSATDLHRAGTLCLAGGVVGIVQAAALLGAPAAVGTDLYSYPFTPAGYAVAQVTFCLQHLLLLAGLLALTRLPAVRGSRMATVTAWGAVVGMALLAALEIVAIAAWKEPTTSALASTITNLYGLPVTLTGLTLTVLGMLLLRARAGLVAGVVLALGIYVFFPLTPAIMGSFTAGRLGIGGWMLLFAVLGLVLRRAPR